jgi:hypothetical protein
MTKLQLYKRVFVGSVTVLVCLVVSALTHGQDVKPDPKTVVLQPFAALDNMLWDVKTSRAELGLASNKLNADRKQLEKDRKSYQADQKSLDQDLAAFAAKKSKMTGRKKWLCNLSKTLHNDPNECDQPELGGVWVSVDASGNPTGRWFAPTKKELDDLQKEEARLALQKGILNAKKDKLQREEQAFKAEAAKFNKQVDDLVRKQDYLRSDPKKVLEDVRNSYLNAVSKTGGKADPTVMRALDKMATTIGTNVGSGQCAPLVQDFAKVGLVKTWKPADNVKDSPLVPFAPAATFVKDGLEIIYPNKATGNHAVIVLDKTDQGLLVFDQSTGHRASVHIIPYLGGSDSLANKAKIEAGEAKAKAWGFSPNDPDDGKAYYNAVYNYKNIKTGDQEKGSYNPSNDADNFSYIQR